MSNDLKSEILNWDVAVLLIANSLAWTLPFENNALLIIMCVVIGVFLIIKPKTILTLAPIPIIAISLFVFIEAFWEQPILPKIWNKYLQEFIALGVPSLYIARSDFNPGKVLRNIGLISLPLLPFIFGKNLSDNRDYGMWMGISYGIISYVIALIYNVFFQYGKYIKRYLKYIFFLVLLGYLIFYIQYASRGSLIAVTMAIILFTFIKLHIRFTKVFIIISAIILLILTFWNEFILLFIEILENFGIESFALSKMIALQDLSNGRSDLLEQGLRIFSSSPIFGHGVGIFEVTYESGYVHNCFIQFLIEGGIIYFSIMTFLIVSSFKFILSQKVSDEKRMFLSFLICAGLIQLLFSSYFWISQMFWFLIGYTLKLLKKKNHSRVTTAK